MNRLIISAQKDQLNTSLTQLKEALESISVDYRESLFIIFQELIINSICEMEGLGLGESNIHLSFYENEDEIVGSLDDLGQGIDLCETCPEEVLSNLDNERGRGLAIVQMLVGTLEVIPLEGPGFKYKFTMKNNIFSTRKGEGE